MTAVKSISILHILIQNASLFVFSIIIYNKNNEYWIKIQEYPYCFLYMRCMCNVNELKQLTVCRITFDSQIEDTSMRASFCCSSLFLNFQINFIIIFDDRMMTCNTKNSHRNSISINQRIPPGDCCPSLAILFIPFISFL